MVESMNRARTRRLVRTPDPSPYWEPRRPSPAPLRVLGRAPACPREALKAAAARKGESLAGLSALIGRGHGYLHRFVTAGVPRALSERDHQVLADYLGMPLGVRDLWVVVEEAA